MTVTMNIPDRLYHYLQQQGSDSEKTLDETLSRAITDILEQQFEQRMNAVPVISHEEFMNLLRKANAHQEPLDEDAL